MLAHHPEDVMPAVTAPTLVLRGENDLVATREWCVRIVATMPDARMSEVPDHGHETLIRDAAPAVALIREFAGDR